MFLYQIHGVESKVDALIEMYKEDRAALTERHRRHTPPHSMHLLPEGPPMTGSILPPLPPPTSCPSFQIHQQHVHRVASKQLSEPNPPRLHRDQAVLRMDLDQRLTPDRLPAHRSLSYTTTIESRRPSSGTLSTLAPPVDERMNDARIGRRVYEDRVGVGVGIGIEIGVVSEGLAKYHVHCPEIAQRLQKASTFSTDSRQSFTSESLASEDDSGSAAIDCFPAPESCTV